MQMDYLSECVRSSINSINRFLGQRRGLAITTDTTVAADQGVFVINTAAANAADVIFPSAQMWPGREISIVNLSGQSQNVVSYNGTALEFKVVTAGAATATHAVETATTTSSGRRTFKSINGLWTLISI